MNLIIYDISMLILFAILVSIFLTSKRKKLQKEGLLFLYRTTWGIKLIDYLGNKYKKTLSFLSYISIGLGYLLMVGVFYLFYFIVKVYLFQPSIVRQIKIPPLMPIVPYIDKLAPGLPSFYFIYWIILIAIIAIVHELAHGIFAARNKIKIKSTGFGFFPFFFPVFLAAFVEQDEKTMDKKSNFAQMAVLSAGTFANILAAIFFFIIMWVFFIFAFTPAGVIFNNYALGWIEVNDTIMINNILIENPTYNKIINSLEEENKIIINNKSYIASRDMVQNHDIKKLYEENKVLLLYHDAPAINAKLKGAITEINQAKITNKEDLSNELSKYSPNDTIIIKTKNKQEITEYNITLSTSPENEDKAFLGVIPVSYPKPENILRRIFLSFSFKDPGVYYEPKMNGVSAFFYDLLWWIIIANISVALINMLPVGIFDGGRFFYLTILSLTKSETKAKIAFAFTTYLFLFIALLLMGMWLFHILN